MVLEVGPGTGNMTVKLLEKAKKVKREFCVLVSEIIMSASSPGLQIEIYFLLIAVILTATLC